MHKTLVVIPILSLSLNLLRTKIPSNSIDITCVSKMKYNPVYLVGITATVVARAADTTTVPDCASGCIDKLVSEYTPCNSKDFGCICDYQETLHLHGAQCIIDSCGVQKATGE